MKKSILSKQIPLTLCAALLLGMTACANNAGTADVTEENTTTTTEYTVAEVEYIGEQGVEVVGGVSLKYLGGYDITKSGDVRPAYNYFKEKFNSEIEIELCVDSEIMTKLATYISSGTSPDLVDRRDNTFPYYTSRSMYEALDEYIDLDSPNWSTVRTYVENFGVNGKHYYFPWAYYVGCNRVLIYNRAVFEEFGISDPVELYNAGNWTWDTFLKCMKDFADNNTIVDNPLGVYGSIGSAFINTTGKAMIGYENGQLINNMRSTEVERAQAFLESIRKEGLSALTYEEYSNVGSEPVVYGYAAFHAVGDWKITDYSKIQQNDDSVDFMFVPFPRDPNADKQYYTFNMFGYMVPAGSENPRLAAEFITCMRMSILDPDLQETTRESIMKNKKYTDEQYNLWKYFQTPENFTSEELVIEFSNSLDATLVNDVIVPILENTAFDQSAEQQSWTSMRETYFPMIDENVNALNEALSKT